MKSLALLFNIALPFVFLGFTSAPAPKPADAAALDAVLKKMDSVATTFRSAQAEFEWDMYEKVIDEVDDVETGTIYYRRNGKGVEMMAEVKKVGGSAVTLKPEPKYVLYSGGIVRLYQPKLDQVTEVDLGKGHSDYESYVVLGFGGSGQDLVKTFDVSYVGPETINGIQTAKLQLIPKSEKVRNTYNKIFLWIDLDRGISLQQQLFQPQGDYRLAKYSDIQVNGKKIPDDVFKLKTTSKTQTITPRS
jgi:outer membrane lipoprotein-sorting protein